MNERSELVAKLQTRFIKDRITQIDPDFLAFELEMGELDALSNTLYAAENNMQLTNPYNSVLLYVLGLTDEFDFTLGRAYTQGGSPPDIDIDFEALGRDQVVDMVAEHWGRDHVANIITFGTFGPKSLTRRYFKITEGTNQQLGDVLDKIPKPIFGKEATMQEILEGNPDKRGYEPHPELRTSPKYSGWLAFASQLEGMVTNFGIHAAGVVISDFPIYKQIPMWKNSKSERITQFDMHECEELGLIKFDFLVINNLDILKECTRLVKQEHGIDLDPYAIPDGNTKAYDLLEAGVLTGVFQMETSGTARDLISRIEPRSISELSDISALNRPGPLESNFHEIYIENKRNGYAPSDLPPEVADLTKDTYWTIVYQEQVMNIVSKLGGFSLRESDDIRRAMGKKKEKVLAAYKDQFATGCLERTSMTAPQVDELWEQLMKFSAYGFNKSHSVSYSIITYLCAYMKANYPLEFFCALMTIRSKTLQSKIWAQRAPEYVFDAKQMDISILPPSVQRSKIGFTIGDNEIYFGLNAIKSVGKTVAASIVQARGNTPFKDIWDFLSRVNTSKVNTKHFVALAKAGAFDRMGYLRRELIENVDSLYSYHKDLTAYQERLIESERRAKENAEKTEAKEAEARQLEDAKEIIKAKKKEGLPVPEWAQSIVDKPKRLREYRARIKETGMEPEEVLATEELQEYNYNQWLRKLPELKLKDKPTKIELTRSKTIKLDIGQLMDQAEMIGCYLGRHPAKAVFPEATSISNTEEGEYTEIAGVIMNYKQIVTKRGTDMCFLQLGDGTGICEGVVFSRQFATFKAQNRLPEEKDIVKLRGRIECTEPNVKILVDSIQIYRRE